VADLSKSADRQALALDTFNGTCRPFPIGDTKAGTIVVAEIKFRKIAASNVLR
jgi:hypothetical protein